MKIPQVFTLILFELCKCCASSIKQKPQKFHNQLLAVLLCDSEAIRTLDPRLRRALLYPAELRNHPYLRMQR